MKFCRHGHPWNEANTRWIDSAAKGVYRQCRACARHKQKLKYRINDEFREKQKRRTLERHHAGKARSECARSADAVCQTGQRDQADAR